MYKEIIIGIYYLVHTVIACVELGLTVYILMGWALMLFPPNSNNIFMKIYTFLMPIIEPIFQYFRQFIPTIGALDFSPIVIFLLLEGVRILLNLVVQILII